MIKFVIFSMLLALALAHPGGDSEQGGAVSQHGKVPAKVPEWMSNNKCYASLLSLSKLTLSNLIDLIACLLDQVIALVEQLLGGSHASSQSSALIKLLNSIRTLLINTLHSVATLLSGHGSSASLSTGISGILKTLTNAVSGLLHG